MQLLQEHAPVFLCWCPIFTDWATKSLGTRSFGNTARFLVTPQWLGGKSNTKLCVKVQTSTSRRCVVLRFGTSSHLDFGMFVAVLSELRMSNSTFGRGRRVKAQPPYPPQIMETIFISYVHRAHRSTRPDIINWCTSVDTWYASSTSWCGPVTSSS